MPAAVVSNAEDQKALPTMPAVRGPTFSTHAPSALVVTPSTTAAQEKTGRSCVCVQSNGAAAITPVLSMHYRKYEVS